MRLLKSTSIYTISNLSKQAIGFALLPIITAYLNEGDIGDLSLITTIVGLLSPIILLSAHGAINVEYFRQDFGKENFKSYASSALINPLILFFILFSCTLLFGKQLSTLLDISIKWIYLIPGLAISTLIPQILSVIYQAKDKPTYHAIYNLSMTSIDLLASILLIVSFSMDWEGRLIGNYGSKILFSIIGLYLLYRSNILSVNIKKEYINNALWFGLPLLPHAIGANVMDLSDRLFIRVMISKEEQGLYDIGYKIGSIILFFQTSLFMALTPYFFKKIKEGGKKVKNHLVKTSYLAVLALLIAFMGLVLISPLIFKFLVQGEAYQESIKYVWIIALAYVFQGIYKIFSIPIFYQKKNSYMSYIAVFNIISNLSLNYLLVPRYGAMGAAYATLASYLLFAFVTFLVSQSLYPMPWLKAIFQKD